jgi:hypothetical protein
MDRGLLQAEGIFPSPPHPKFFWTDIQSTTEVSGNAYQVSCQSDCCILGVEWLSHVFLNVKHLN